MKIQVYFNHQHLYHNKYKHNIKNNIKIITKNSNLFLTINNNNKTVYYQPHISLTRHYS